MLGQEGNDGQRGTTGPQGYTGPPGRDVSMCACMCVRACVCVCFSFFPSQLAKAALALFFYFYRVSKDLEVNRDHLALLDHRYSICNGITWLFLRIYFVYRVNLVM